MKTILLASLLLLGGCSTKEEVGPPMCYVIRDDGVKTDVWLARIGAHGEILCMDVDRLKFRESKIAPGFR